MEQSSIEMINDGDMPFLRTLQGVLGIDKAALDIYMKEHPVQPLSTGKRKSDRLIISLTSFPGRCHEIHYVLYSIFRQTLLPDMVVLYLSEDEFPDKEKDLPDTLLDWRTKGLEIRWVKNNLKPYNKLIYALKDFPKNVIVTVDDDIFYQAEWLEKLYSAYMKAGKPATVFASRTHFIQTDQHGLKSYSNWLNSTGVTDASFRNFLTGVGGVLYPPHCLDLEVMNMDVAQRLTPRNDDVWFHMMAVKNKSGVVFAKESAHKLIFINLERELRLSGEVTLASQNVVQGGNDIQLKNVLEYYPELMSLIVNETPASQRFLFRMKQFPRKLIQKIKSRLPVSSRSFHHFADQVSNLQVQMQYAQNTMQQILSRMQQQEQQTHNQMQQMRGQVLAQMQQEQQQTLSQMQQLQQMQGQFQAQMQQMQGQIQAQMQQEQQQILSQMQQTQGQIQAQAQQISGQAQQQMQQIQAQAQQISGQAQQQMQQMQGQIQAQMQQEQQQILGQMQQTQGQLQAQMQQEQQQILGQMQQTQGQLQAQIHERFQQMSVDHVNVMNREAFVIRHLLDEKMHAPVIACQMKENLEQMLSLPQANALPVVFITDSNYAEPTAVAISSLIRNRAQNTRYQVYVVVTDVSESLLKIFDRFQEAVKIIQHRPRFTISNSEHLYVSPAALMKFSLPGLFPQHDKILYLDSDMLVRKDLTPLFQTGISGVYAAVVKDAAAMLLEKDHEVLGLKNYFNSGMMLLNLKKMRDEAIEEKLCATKEKHSYPPHFMDQDEFNFVFHEQVNFIAPQYNLMFSNNLNIPAFTLAEFYGLSLKKMFSVMNDPVILHLTHCLKPWDSQLAVKYEEYRYEKIFYDLLR